MNQSEKNKTSLYLGVVIVILIIVIGAIVAHSTDQNGAIALDTSGVFESTTTIMSSMATSSMATSSMSSSAASVSGITVSPLAFAISIPRHTYSRTEEIDFALGVLNLTNETQTFNFTDGCQAAYSIGSFNMLDHMTCLPNPSSFSLAPHAIKAIPLSYYPSVSELPAGTYTLTAHLIGYGSTSVPITITN